MRLGSSRRSLLVGLLVAANLGIGAAVWLDPDWHREPPTDRPEPPTASPAEAVVGDVVLALSGADVLVRAERGSCNAAEPAQVWVAAPGEPPKPVEAQGLVAFYAAFTDGDRVTLVGADAECETTAVEASLDGDGDPDFTAVDVPEREYWAGEGGAVHYPQGEKPSAQFSCQPDEATVVVRRDDGVPYLGCGSGGITPLEPGAGPTWPMPDLAQLALRAPGEGWALTRSADCRSQLWVLREDDADWTKGECLGADAAPLGLVASPDLLVAQVGERLLQSTDAGASWQERA